ncbi:hypothetical protein BS78_02G381700 [Paspalum vaginatum]|nr:hypothetical protein BS78_02G381700 [Paspalum vaginatum]
MSSLVMKEPSPTDMLEACVSVSSRCAVRLVQSALASFDETKVRLVNSIGFGGLLKIPAIRSINKHLSLWLLTKVDEAHQAIVVDSLRVLTLTGRDVGLVFGIPSTGDPVVCRPRSKGGVANLAVRQPLNVPQAEQVSIKFVQEIIEKKYDAGMTEEDEACFKVAFVMFVMASFLAPGAKHDYCSADYWDALAVPSKIQCYDWSSYVLRRLLASASRLRVDLASGRKGSNITCCPLFLQVLYLDSINLGPLNMRHDSLPRISQFTSDRLKSMIAMDSTNGRTTRRVAGFGQSEVCSTHSYHSTRHN